MSLLSRLSGHDGRNVADQRHDNVSEVDYDGKSVDDTKITFGCNQHCPSVGLSPTYPPVVSKALSGVKPHRATSSSPLDFVPQLQITINPHLKKNLSQMFSLKNRRVSHKHSGVAGKSKPKPKPQPQVVRSKPMTSSAFDEMLMSNQTIYLGGVNDSQFPKSYHSREVFYSNVPLSTEKTASS